MFFFSSLLLFTVYKSEEKTSENKSTIICIYIISHIWQVWGANLRLNSNSFRTCQPHYAPLVMWGWCHSWFNKHRPCGLEIYTNSSLGLQGVFVGASALEQWSHLHYKTYVKLLCELKVLCRSSSGGFVFIWSFSSSPSSSSSSNIFYWPITVYYSGEMC